MRFYGNTGRAFIAGGVGALIALCSLSAYIEFRLDAYKESMTERLEATEKAYLTRAIETDRTEAISESRAVVFDCSERVRFEELLSKLDTLTVSERTELDRLFAGCGDYYHRLKLFLVGELETLKDTYALHLGHYEHIFAHDDTRASRLLSMEELIEEERARASLMREQVILQSDFISARKQPSRTVSSELETRSAELGRRLAESNTAVDRARAAFEAALGV